jgi:tetratricopeptide (TPR) repeat protein
LAVVAIAIAGVVATKRLGGGAASRDTRLVAVLPFRVAGADPSLRYLREGMVDLLAAKLTGSTRVADPRAALSAWRAAGGTESNDLDASAARGLAERLGASEVLLGDVTGGTGTVVLRAQLIPVDGGDPRDATVEGPQDSVSVLVDRLAVQLLALRAGERAATTGALVGTPLAAVRDYLDGQVEMRGGRYHEALTRYRAAVQADSNMAVAWYGFMDAAVWLSLLPQRDSAERQVWRLRDKLPIGTRAVVEAQLGSSYPITPTNAESRRLAERAVQAAPDSPQAWHWLGEVLYHWSPTEGLADAHARAISAFERALALDSTYTQSLEHLVDLYYGRDDTVMLRRAVDARLARDSTTELAAVHLYIADVVLGDARRGTMWRQLAARDAAQLANIKLMSDIFALPDAGVDSLMQRNFDGAATDADRATAGFLLVEHLTNRGQPDRAARVARSTGGLRAGQYAENTLLTGMFNDVDSALVAEARQIVAARAANDSVAKYRYTYFAAALDGLQRGSRDIAVRVIPLLDRAPPGQCNPRVPTYCKALAVVLDAQLAANDNRPDAPAKLAALDSMLREGPVRAGGLLYAGNLIAARLWEKAGNQARALAAVRRQTHFNGPRPYQSTTLREEGRLAAATGDRDGAIRAYRKYLALRSNAEPSLKAHLDGVRREMQKLESSGR